MNRRNLLKLLVGMGAVGGAGGLIYESPRIREELTRLTHFGPSNRPFPDQLVDVTDQAGIVFHHNSGAFGEKYLPETLGSGCAFLDYENDGWLDILLINGKDWPGHGEFHMDAEPKDGLCRPNRDVILLVLGLLLVFNAAYLAAYATPDLFYVINALLHPFLGVVAAIVFVLYLTRHREVIQDLSGKLSVICLALAAGFGIYLFFAGMTVPHSLALYLHVGFSIGGLFFLLLSLRSWARGRTELSFVRKGWQVAGTGFVAALVFYGGVSLYHHYFPNPWDSIKNPLTAPTSLSSFG